MEVDQTLESDQQGETSAAQAPGRDPRENTDMLGLSQKQLELNAAQAPGRDPRESTDMLAPPNQPPGPAEEVSQALVAMASSEAKDVAMTGVPEYQIFDMAETLGSRGATRSTQEISG